MNKSLLDIKYKNNHHKVYEIIFKLESNNYTYIVYKCNEFDAHNNEILYAAKYKDEKNLQNLNEKEKKFIKEVLDNLSKEE